MGCDIHLHVEIKVNGKWHHYSHPHIMRNYQVFCMMAGVRQYGEDDEPKPISPPRGLPNDATFTTQFDSDHWDTDGHSHSWLTDAEAGRVQEWYEERFKPKVSEGPLFGYLFGNYIDSYLKYAEDGKSLFEMGYECARVCFWFDN